MAYCVQCGEPISLDQTLCPACGRAVGESSIGVARERQPSKTALRLLGAMAALVAALLGVWVLVIAWRAKPTLDRAQLAAVQKLARPSLVSLVAPSGHAGGIVITSVGGGLLVATEAGVAPVGSEARLQKDGHTSRGVVLAAGPGRAGGLDLVFVPSAAGLDTQPAGLAAMPKAGDLVVTFGAGGSAAGSGRVVSVQKGPGAGTLAFDAPLSADGRGFGLWSREGRLVALCALDPKSGGNRAVAAQALFARTYWQETPLISGAEWSEVSVPLVANSRTAIALSGPSASELAARLGETGAITRGQQPWPGLAVLQLDVVKPAPLEISGAAPAGAPATRALVLVLGRI